MKHKTSIERQMLDDVLLQLQKLKKLAEDALAQIRPEQTFLTLDPESNSIAVLMKHMAGNMRSRWTDFLTTDGEKPDRERDREFVIEASDTAESVLAAWEDGWSRVLDAVASLEPGDLGRTVRIRGEAHTVVEAINRQLTHYAAHVGQIVLLARHHAGPLWRPLSIPKGRSGNFDVAKSGASYPLTSSQSPKPRPGDLPAR